MRTLTLIILFLTSIALKGQEFQTSSQLNRNMVYLNPAYTGIHETTVANLMHKTHWLGTINSYNFQNFEVHSPLKSQSVAFGLQVRNEQIGATTTSEVFFNYSHRIRMNTGKLALALKGGIVNSGTGELSLKSGEPDQAFLASQSHIMPNFGFGVAYYTDKYYAGVSVPYFLESVSGSDGNASISFNINSFQYIASVGGSFPVGSSIDFEPAGAFVYSQLNPITYSVIFNAKFNDMIVGGVGYRANEAIIFNAGYYLNNQLSVMYSYDLNMGDVGTYSSGSHEIGLLLHWGFKVNTLNPRDF